MILTRLTCTSTTVGICFSSLTDIAMCTYHVKIYLSFADFFGYAQLDLIDRELSSIHNKIRKKQWMEAFHHLEALIMFNDLGAFGWTGKLLTNSDQAKLTMFSIRSRGGRWRTCHCNRLCLWCLSSQSPPRVEGRTSSLD